MITELLVVAKYFGKIITKFVLLADKYVSAQSNEWPSMAFTNIGIFPNYGFLTAFAKPKPYLSSIFQSFSNLTWLLSFMTLMALSLAFASTVAIYSHCAPNLFVPGYDLADMILFKTWLAITEYVSMNWFSKKALSGY